VAFFGPFSPEENRMKLVTYLDSQKREKVGILVHDSTHKKDLIIDAMGAISNLPLHEQPKPLPIRMLDVIENQATLLPLLQNILTRHEAGTLPPSLSLNSSQITLLAPIPRPVSMRDGYAFRQHVEAARKNRGLPMIPEFDHFPARL
jgi:fumarylacetoacetate (FAA) hydrolase